MLIIWDFNGTLLDDVKASTGATNVLLRDRGLPTVTDMDWYREHFRFPIKDYYAEIGFDYTRESYDDIAVEWLGYYTGLAAECGLMPGVAEALEKLSAQGHRQIIVSASSEEALLAQTEALGIMKYFDTVRGLGNAKAESKLDLTRECIEQSGFTPDKVLFVGDTSHDADAAEAAGAMCALVEGGHESARKLKLRSAAFTGGSVCRVLRSAYELPDCVNEISGAQNSRGRKRE